MVSDLPLGNKVVLLIAVGKAMSRFIRKLHPEFPIHVTGRCNNRENFPVRIETAWDIFGDYLHLLHYGFKIEIRSFVLMNNHFHLICNDPELNLSKGMQLFMRQTSHEMGRLGNRINRIWGAPFFSSVISHPTYYLHAYKYNYRNPTSAGLCHRVEEYPWSTLSTLLGNSKSIIPVAADETLFNDIDDTLRWLNFAYTPIEAVHLKTALKKKVFKLPRTLNGNKQNPLMNLEALPFNATSFRM